MDDIEQALDRIGPRLRAVRAERDITLAAVSESTGISVSTLSRLESGQRKATLELLLALAKAYRLSLDELVDAPPTGDPRVRPKPRRAGSMTVIPLSTQPGGLQVFKMVLHERKTPERPRTNTHEGFEWLYVLSGRLRLILGDQEMVLAAGEAAEFDTRVPHWFGRAENGYVEVLVLFGPQGERVHLRAKTR